MAIVPVSDSGSPTAWERFKYNAKSAYNDMRAATLRSAGYSPVDTPLKDAINNFMNQWATPAYNDAKSMIESSKTYQSLSSVSPVISNLAHDAKESLANVQAPTGRFNYSAGSSGSSYSSVVPANNSALNYLYADLAAHYGMDQKAAYSEALQNTAYQRAVADLKRAGLNPVLAVNGLAPAGSYAAGNTLAGASGSGSSGGYRSGNSGRSYAFDSDTYNLIGVTGTVVGAIVGLVASPKAPVLGASTGAMLGKQLTQSLAQAVTSASRLK